MQIKDRWLKHKDVLVKTGELGDSPFGQIEGRKDYRGLFFPTGSRLVKRIFRNVDLSKACFTGAWIEDCTFEDVLFSATDLVNISEHGNVFKKCVFEKSKFSGAVLGFNGTKYIETEFVGCIFSKTGFIRAEFSNCTFRECRMDGVDFNASSFDQCEFKGILKEIWFRGGYMVATDEARLGKPRLNSMKNVSFKNAEIHDAVFSQGCRLDTIIMPDKGNYIRVSDWQRKLQSLQHQASLTPGSAGKKIGIFAKVHLVHASGQDQYILNKEDIVKGFGEDAASIIWKSFS
jgi:hypothetical protein